MKKITRLYNDEFYHLFNEIADLLELLNENGFKIRAYRTAAQRLKEVAPITQEKATLAVFKKIPGVGEAIAEKMMQYIQTGQVDYLEDLRGRVPKGVRELLRVPHLGPKRVRQLHLNLGIQSPEDFAAAARRGEIDPLPGFGPRLIEQILSAIGSGRLKKKRHLRPVVEPYAKTLLALLQKIPGVQRAHVAGSFRRGLPEVGDLDFVVLGQGLAVQAEQVILAAFPDALWLGSGPTKLSFVVVPEQLQVDLRFVPEESYGAALLYFTGNKEFNIMMRKKAIQRDMLLNEYGLFTKDGEYIAGRTEEEVFKALAMKYQSPEKRQV